MLKGMDMESNSLWMCKDTPGENSNSVFPIKSWEIVVEELKLSQ